jgi:predicted Rossmann fold nucleotide-binding protein DprA/Smf involved in DNA uptake
MADPDIETVICSAIELTLIPGIGTLTQNRIWKAHPDLAGIFPLGETEWARLGLPADTYPAMRTRAYRAIAEELHDWGTREGCSFLMRGMRGYPILLEEIYDPPLILYAKGRTDS